jgi:hypothetical protein
MAKGAPNQSAGLSAPSAFRYFIGVLLLSAASLLPLSVVAQTASDPELNLARERLMQGDGAAARELLLPLIWGGDIKDQTALAELRRLVIRSYLVEGRQGDAHSAMLRYEQDYGDAVTDSAWIAIKARVMIADGQTDDAALVAVASEDPEGRAVYTLALLKGATAMDEELLRESVAALNNMALDQPLRRALFAAALEKGLAVPVSAERIVVLQQLLTLPEVSGVSTTAAVDGLWSAYSEHGQEAANRQQLLVGDFTPWFDAASRLQATAPMQSQALYVWMALHAESSEYQIKAHELFVSQLSSQPQGEALLRLLYLSSSRYNDLKKAPAAVLYQLVELYRALLQREIQRHSAQR